MHCSRIKMAGNIRLYLNMARRLHSHYYSGWVCAASRLTCTDDLRHCDLLSRRHVSVASCSWRIKQRSKLARLLLRARQVETLADLLRVPRQGRNISFCTGLCNMLVGKDESTDSKHLIAVTVRILTFGKLRMLTKGSQV